MSHLQVLPNTGNRGSHSREKFFLKIRNRYRWLLDSGGEIVLLYKRKYEGTRCPLFDQVRKTSQQNHFDDVCFGTGFVGGYFKPIEIYVSLISGADEQIVSEEFGRRRIYTPKSWTLWEPLLQNGDFIVRRNNQRLWITNVYQRRWKHYVTRQDFSTAEVERNASIYNIPI